MRSELNDIVPESAGFMEKNVPGSIVRVPLVRIELVATSESLAPASSVRSLVMNSPIVDDQPFVAANPSSVIRGAVKRPPLLGSDPLPLTVRAPSQDSAASRYRIARSVTSMSFVT
jgi:hypothetical protein